MDGLARHPYRGQLCSWTFRRHGLSLSLGCHSYCVHRSPVRGSWRLGYFPACSSLGLPPLAVLPAVCHHVKGLYFGALAGFCAADRDCTDDLLRGSLRKRSLVAELLPLFDWFVLHSHNAVCRFQFAVHELAAVEFGTPNVGIAIRLSECLPGCLLVVVNIISHVMLAIHD